MRQLNYLAAAFDYDGTLAGDGRVTPSTVKALQALKASGRRLLMVTGRELEDLLRVFPEVTMFDLIVCENGGLLYNPTTKEERKLTDDASLALVEELKKSKVEPVHVGRCIVATWEPFHQVTLDAIHKLGLELQVIFNKGAVMVLPSGINKGTGLFEALKELELSPHNVIGAGDAENDHAFLSLCQVSVAVKNALPAIKERADIITVGDHGAGIEEMIEQLLKDEFASMRLPRHQLSLGTRENKEEVKINPLSTNILIAGPSGGGKSNATLGILDTLSSAGYQFCLIDPEGDYESFGNAVVLGDTQNTPSADEVLQLLRNPGVSAIVNLLGLPLEDRPAFFSALIPRLQEMRTELGRPHWLVIDEAHHLLPKDWLLAPNVVPHKLKGMILITVHPSLVAPDIIRDIDYVLAVSESPEETIQDFNSITEVKSPKIKKVKLEKGQALMWRPREKDSEAEVIDMHLSDIERRRHRRKYAEGELPEDSSFYFTGPHKLRLRAQNLITFVQLAEGLDDDTWLYHLARKEYSKWFHENIKDEQLADAARTVESDDSVSAKKSKEVILKAIEERYTAPAEAKK